MSLSQYLNRFQEEDFEDGPFGRSVLKGAPAAYYTELARIEAEDGADVEWVPVAAGRHPNGIPWYVGRLTLTYRERTGTFTGAVLRVTTVPGAAEGESAQMGISGVATTALGNALLRGLGMAAWLYDREALATPPAPLQAPLQAPPVGVRRPFPGTSPAAPGQPKPQGGYGDRPWDGSKVYLKSGRYEGQPYSAIPIQDLQKWASGDNPNRQAQKELAARMAAGGGVDMSGGAFNQGGQYGY